MAAQVEAGLLARGLDSTVARRFFEAAVGRDAARARMHDAFSATAAAAGEKDCESEEAEEWASGPGAAAALAESRCVGMEEIAAALAAPGGSDWAFLAEQDPRTSVLWALVRSAVAAEFDNGGCSAA